EVQPQRDLGRRSRRRRSEDRQGGEGQVVTALIAVIGIAFVIYGLFIFIVFGVACATLGRLQKTALYTHVRNTDTVKGGEAMIGAAIEMIPNTFIRKMVSNKLGADSSDMAFSVAFNLLKGRSRSGIWIAAAGI